MPARTCARVTGRSIRGASPRCSDNEMFDYLKSLYAALRIGSGMQAFLVGHGYPDSDK